jgi:cell wall-associated NlpC family hydrolase
MNSRPSASARCRRIASAGALALILVTPGGPAVAGGDPTGSRATASGAWRGAEDLAMLALGMVGVDYESGGSTPATGLDCSGLVRYVFQQVTGATLPRTAQEMARLGKSVARTELQVGDLVFFRTRHSTFSHVGIYLGDERFVHAPSPGRAVEIVALSARYWQERYSGARRLLAAAPKADGEPATAALSAR